MSIISSLDTKMIIVSGAGSGIGKSIALDLVSKGAKVVLLGRNLKNLQKVQGKINNPLKEKSAYAFQCDISDPSSVDFFIKQLKEVTNSIYGLVNNAGINPSRNNILETESSDWESAIATNLSGTFYLTQAVMPLLMNSESGSIVNISSIAGILGMKERFSYSVCKSALVGFTKSLSTDFAKNNIRANCICPGYIKTKLTMGYFDSLDKDSHQKLLDKHPLLGFGKEQYIADAVSFLLSEESKWMTGATLPIDGGYSLGRD